jgi:hypothetical protein
MFDDQRQFHESANRNGEGESGESATFALSRTRLSLFQGLVPVSV